jgi:hypothetical protein
LPHPPIDGNAAEFGAPLIGLSAEQLAAFAAGREEFRASKPSRAA